MTGATMRTKAQFISSAVKMTPIVIALAVGIPVVSWLSAPRPPEPPIFTAAEALDRAKTAHAQGDAFWEFTWTRVAALYRDAGAQNELGVTYDLGRIIPQDYGEAARWYRRAIERRNSSAKANLGRMYALGLGIATGLDEAERLFREAAEQGVPTAQNSLKMVQAKEVDNRNSAITLGIGGFCSEPWAS
jgi:TPR repeat protein